MPIFHRRDELGQYFQWGYHGHKYRYSPNDSHQKDLAYRRAEAQGNAVRWAHPEYHPMR
jgi:hypothetical protein